MTRKQHRAVIYPPGAQIFNALDSTPFEQVRVVILGQDPYHGPGQAHGLCFSVQHGVRVPPSLANIYREIEADLGIAAPHHGCLQTWAEQGVLLLNAVLTVERGQAGSHQGKGWETFTDAVVQLLNDEREGLVFMLWGSYAQKKGAVIDRKSTWYSRHRIRHRCRHTVASLVAVISPAPMNTCNSSSGNRLTGRCRRKSCCKRLVSDYPNRVKLVNRLPVSVFRQLASI